MGVFENELYYKQFEGLFSHPLFSVKIYDVDYIYKNSDQVLFWWKNANLKHAFKNKEDFWSYSSIPELKI